MNNIKYILIICSAGLVLVSTYYIIKLLASNSEYACNITNIFSKDFSSPLNRSIKNSLSNKNPSIDFRQIGSDWQSVCLTSRNYAGDYDSYNYGKNMETHYDIIRKNKLNGSYKGKKACWGWSSDYISVIFLSKNGVFANKHYIPQDKYIKYNTDYIKGKLEIKDVYQCASVKNAVASCLWLERVPGKKECHIYFKNSKPNLIGENNG